jgi:hypothetical protein
VSGGARSWREANVWLCLDAGPVSRQFVHETRTPVFCAAGDDVI